MKKGRVLLKSIAPIEGEKDEDHFFPYQIHSDLDNGKTVKETEDITYKRWLYIEIENSKEVTIHLEFVHPEYKF